MSNLNSWISAGEQALGAGVGIYDAATGKTIQTTATSSTAPGTSSSPAPTSTAASQLPSFLTSSTTEWIVIGVGAVAIIAAGILFLRK